MHSATPVPHCHFGLWFSAEEGNLFLQSRVTVQVNNFGAIW